MKSFFPHPAAVAAAAVLLTGCGGPARRPITGLIDATEVDVASKIPGRVKELKVKEGDHVSEGQELAVIDSQEVRAKIDQVSAALDGARARLELARHGARPEEREATRQGLEAARHQLDLSRKMYERMQALLATGSVPQATFDDAEFKYNLAKDQLAIAESKYDLVVRGARLEELQALEALVKQGEGTLTEVRSYGSEMSQTAPLSGEVAKVVLHRGELAATGYPIVTLVDRSDAWATFPVREDLLRSVHQGSRIRVEVPALGRTVDMTITSISAMGDFATWKATTEKASFDLKSFEVKARPVEPVAELRPGMSVRWTPEG
jgi:HlyD family secretion protein